VGAGPLGALVKTVFMRRKSSGYEKLLQGFLSTYGMLGSTDLHKQIQTLAVLKKLPVAQSRYFAHSYTFKKLIPLFTKDRHYALTLRRFCPIFEVLTMISVRLLSCGL
jgi:hypothetical protein